MTIDVNAMDFLLTVLDLMQRSKKGIVPFVAGEAHIGENSENLLNCIVYDPDDSKYEDCHRVVMYTDAGNTVGSYLEDPDMGYQVVVTEDEEGPWVEVIVGGNYVIGIANGELLYHDAMPFPLKEIKKKVVSV